MNKYQKIFDRHYFSNHHIEAMQSEAMLKEIFSKKHAVLFSNFLTLIMALNDELNANLAADLSIKSISVLNDFLRATERREIRQKTDKDVENFLTFMEPFNNKLKWNISYLYLGSKPNSAILGIDLPNMITNITALITDDDEIAEKMRWSRASYGREGSADINIKSNARVSELHACEIKHFLEDYVNN